MKRNIKSSIALPEEEFRLVETLKGALGAKTNVEVVRHGLRLLKDSLDRRRLRNSFQQASRATRAALLSEMDELDHLSDEGLER